MKHYRSIVPLLSLSLFVGSFSIAAQPTLLATANDPEEPSVVDGKDFQSVQFFRDGDNLKTVISFYGDVDPSLNFFYYVCTTASDAPDMVVRASYNGFDIGTLINGRGGPTLYAGAAAVQNNTYTIVFPWNKLCTGCSSIKAYLFNMSAQEGLPDNGRILINWGPGGVPAAPTLTQPANNARIYHLTPTLTVASVSGATAYRFTLKDDATGTQVSQVEIATASWTVPANAIQANKTYAWSAAVKNATGWGTTSGLSKFQTVISGTTAPATTGQTIVKPCNQAAEYAQYQRCWGWLNTHTFDLGSSKAIKTVSGKTVAGPSEQKDKKYTWQLRISNDNAAWTSVGTLDAYGASERAFGPINVNSSARYVQVFANSNGFVDFSELTITQ
jgi:hypothetical protein